jgi:tetratricopeptide (TPR) repeat protein
MTRPRHRGSKSRVRSRLRQVWLTGYLICQIAAPLVAGFRKEAPVGLILAADGAEYQPYGTRTPLQARAGTFLFEGDILNAATGPVRFLWCPSGVSRKFDYTIAGNPRFTLSAASPPFDNGVQPDICLLPAVERKPEVATLPALEQILPAPLPASTAARDIANTPPTTAATLQAMASRDRKDPRIRLSFAAMLLEAGLIDEAIDELRVIARLWPDEVRFGRLILDLLQSGSTREIVHPRPQIPGERAPSIGKTYALVVGIRHYEQANIDDLYFSDADASEFARFLQSDRGGKADVVTLLNQQAKAGDIRNHLNDIMTRLRKDDTFVLFVAAHGSMQGDTPAIVTYRANPQDTSINGLPLTDVQKLLFGEKSLFPEVRVFLDICHAGKAIGQIRENVALMAPVLSKKARAAPRPTPPKNFWYFAATHEGPDAYAYEDPIFGHGIFSYFLLRGLRSDEARVGDRRIVTAGSLSDYVEKWVQQATKGPRDKEARQKPLSRLGMPLGAAVANLDLPSPTFDSRPLERLVVPPERLGKMTRQIKAPKQPAPDPPPSASAIPAELQQRIALENEGEEILLRYLEGDEVPQRVEDFRRCADVYAEALRLQPGSPYLEARRVFCRARALVFDKRYRPAIRLFERAIRLDPAAAYSYNGLGLAYIEEGDYPRARAAFEDAIDRAPRWAYPRHNLALVHTQTGDYNAAIAVYRAAMERAPDYSYLPYNLGLVLQRINRYSDAEAAFRLAIAKANRCEPYVALGALLASEKKWKEAERQYRIALTMPAGELTLRTLRHNLGDLLARTDGGWAEAQQLWRQNGDYLPSQLVLAEALVERGQSADAIQLCRKILSAAPDHLSSRLLLAAELQRTGKQAESLLQLRIALSMQPGNPALLEKLAVSFPGSGAEAEVARLLRAILDNGEIGDPEVRAGMRRALKRLEAR